MSSIEISRPPFENVSQIVNRIKLIGENLKIAIAHQDNLNKDCFGTNVTDERIENLKKQYTERHEEYQALMEEVKAGEARLQEITKEYKTILEEKTSLKESLNGISSQGNVCNEDVNTANELREKLLCYKLLTGIRFDFTPENNLSGYVGLSGSEASESTLLPFNIDKNNSSSKQLLWDKIAEACSEIISSN